MNVSDYKNLYEEILEMSFDMNGVSAYYGITEEGIEKCKWIASILIVLNDVPRSKMECIFKRKNIEFEYAEFINKVKD